LPVEQVLDLTDLLKHTRIMIPSGVPGLYARNGAFEAVTEALQSVITASGAADEPETLRFPPVIDQSVLYRNGYFVGFPHLAGCVHSFSGSVTDHKRLLYKLMSDEPAGDDFVPTGCALTPAACYPVYPLIAARGALPLGGALIDVESYCFRREPSNDPARMQSFRMREFVRIGAEDEVRRFRDDWLTRAGDVMGQLGLPGQVKPAHDPFFGASGAALAAGQEAAELKFEMLLPVSSHETLTACMSFNYHETHFTAAWGLRDVDGTLAHSACVGFGIERLVLALFVAHGPDSEDWPMPVRRALWPSA
jgi:seryl-tRNA synthetase